MENWIRRNPNQDIVAGIAIIAPSIHCPNIVLTFYAAEIIGYTPELIKSIEGLMKQGNIEVLNQPPGSPFLNKK